MDAETILHVFFGATLLAAIPLITWYLYGNTASRTALCAVLACVASLLQIIGAVHPL